LARPGKTQHLPEWQIPGSKCKSQATAAKVTVEANLSNDLLLDNGAQIEMTLGHRWVWTRDRWRLLSAQPCAGAGQIQVGYPLPSYAGYPAARHFGYGDPRVPGTPSTTIREGRGCRTSPFRNAGHSGYSDTGTPGTPDARLSLSGSTDRDLQRSVTINQMPSQNSVRRRAIDPVWIGSGQPREGMTPMRFRLIAVFLIAQMCGAQNPMVTPPAPCRLLRRV